MPPFTERNIKDRLVWAKKQKSWKNEWKKELWADVKRVQSSWFRSPLEWGLRSATESA